MLADYAPRRDHSQSMVAEAAIASFLSPDADERREATFAKRIDRRLTRIERDFGIAVETLAVFIRSSLRPRRPSQSPPPGPPARKPLSAMVGSSRRLDGGWPKGGRWGRRSVRMRGCGRKGRR